MESWNHYIAKAPEDARKVLAFAQLILYLWCGGKRKGSTDIYIQNMVCFVYVFLVVKGVRDICDHFCIYIYRI